MTWSHWLVTQSVTSYIYRPDTGPGVFSFWSVPLLRVRWLVKHPVVWVSTSPCTGSMVHFRQQPLLRGISSRASAPRYIPFRVLPWSQPNLVQRSGAPGDVRYLHTVYGEYAIKCISRTRAETVFVLFLSWDLKHTGLMTNSGPVPFVPWGTTHRVWQKLKTYTTRRLLPSMKPWK